MAGRLMSPLGARLFVALQHVLPQHLLSRVVYHVTRSRLKPVKNALISSFMKGFEPDMSDAAEPNPLRYPSFNAFFTRALRDDARPMPPDPRAIASPVDGTVSQIGHIDGSRMIQAKGHDYPVEALLAGPSKWTSRFSSGTFATIYLAPYNYHRIHMPLAGELHSAWYVPGRLFSVNNMTAASVPSLFARNERIVCVFEDGDLCFAMILVGALFVGSMSTVWHDEVTPKSPRRPMPLPVSAGLRLDRGAEMGRFNMGSTVILLFPRGSIEWATQFSAGTRLRVGENLGRLL
jgi:phosphatidylserine decarboxylase